MAVIAVLGLLAGVVVVAVRGIDTRGSSASCAQDRRVLATAQEAHFARHGRYASQAGLVAAGFLDAPSTLHRVEPADPVTAYTIVPAAACAAPVAAPTTAPGTAPPTTAPTSTTLPPTTTTTLPPEIVLTEVGSEGWLLNGTAAGAGTVALTSGGRSQTGSVFSTTEVPRTMLAARFTLTLKGRGEGVTFILLDADAPARSLGEGAWQLGYGGLPGVAVVFDTARQRGDPAANFVGIATGVERTSLTWAATNTKIPDLWDATHHVEVLVEDTTITVWLDGAQVLTATVPVPKLLRPGFSAATSTSRTGAQYVGDVKIVATP